MKRMVQAVVLMAAFLLMPEYLWINPSARIYPAKKKSVQESGQGIQTGKEPKKYEERSWRLPGNGSFAAVVPENKNMPVSEGTVGYQELTLLLEEQKRWNPESYPLYVSGRGITAGEDISSYFIAYTCPWGNLAMGVIMEDEPDRIVNLFETEEFYEFICQMRDWYEGGYLLPDGATTRVSLADALENGEVSGYLYREPAKEVGAESVSADLARRMESQIGEIENTMEEFLKGLETGCCASLDEEYQAFLRDLHTAGIDAVIAENSRCMEE